MEKFMVSNLWLVSMETTNQTESFKLTNEKYCQRENRFFYSSWKKFSTSSFLPIGKPPIHDHSQENQQMVLWRRLIRGERGGAQHIPSKWAPKLFHGVDRGKSDISVILNRPSQFFWGLITMIHLATLTVSSCSRYSIRWRSRKVHPMRICDRAEPDSRSDSYSSSDRYARG